MNVLINILIIIPVMAFAIVGLTAWFVLALDLVQDNRTAPKGLRWTISFMPVALIVMLFVGVLA